MVKYLQSFTAVQRYYQSNYNSVHCFDGLIINKGFFNFSSINNNISQPNCSFQPRFQSKFSKESGKNQSKMENSLASLPLAILHIILSKVATNSIQDFGNANVALRSFNELAKDHFFYGVANVLYMNHWFNETRGVVTFLQRCYDAGNPEAIYLRGMYEFFKLHLVDEGRQKIRHAGEAGLELAKFVDSMMTLAFSVDESGFVQNYPDFSRQHFDRMFRILDDWRLGDAWDYVNPPAFVSVFDRLTLLCNIDCWCSRIEPPHFVVSIDGSRSHWKCNRCFWQEAAWNFCDTVPLRTRGWPLEGIED